MFPPSAWHSFTRARTARELASRVQAQKWLVNWRQHESATSRATANGVHPFPSSVSARWQLWKIDWLWIWKVTKSVCVFVLCSLCSGTRLIVSEPRFPGMLRYLRPLQLLLYFNLEDWRFQLTYCLEYVWTRLYEVTKVEFASLLLLRRIIVLQQISQIQEIQPSSDRILSFQFLLSLRDDRRNWKRISFPLRVPSFNDDHRDAFFYWIDRESGGSKRRGTGVDFISAFLSLSLSRSISWAWIIRRSGLQWLKASPRETHLLLRRATMRRYNWYAPSTRESFFFSWSPPRRNVSRVCSHIGAVFVD